MATRTIGTEIVLSGEKAFNDAMKGVNNNLRNLRTDMAAVSSEFDGNANSMDALTAKQKVLSESVDQHKAKVDALRQMYDEQKKKYGENSAQADKFRQQLNQATVSLNKEEAALRKNTAALEAAQKSEKQYTPITQRLANAVKEAGEKVKNFAGDVSDGAHHLPVLGEALDVAKVGFKGLGTAAKGAGSVIKGVGSAAGTAVSGLTKGIGAVTAASAAGVAAIGAGAVALLTSMASMAKEAAEAAKAAQEAGETLTASQEQWLAFSGQLDTLDASVASAKSALGGVLLPILGDLSEEGAAFLNSFAADMEAAAGDTEKQGRIMADYIAKGAKLIKEKLPEYIQIGKELLSSLGEGLAAEGPELLDMGIDLVMDLMDQIIEYAPEMAEAGIALIEKLVQSLIDQGPELVTSAVGMVTEIVTGLAQAAPDLIPAAVQLVTQLIIALIECSPDLLLAGLELVYGIISGIFEGLGDIFNSAGDIVDTIVEAFGDKADEFLKIGSDLIALIKQGITDAWSGLVSWFNGLWDGLTGNRTITVNATGTGTTGADGSHAGGLNYVPFDGYLAELHRGEMVLTASEAALYRYGHTAGKQVVQQTIINIYPKSINQAEIDMLTEYADRKMGEEL